MSDGLITRIEDYLACLPGYTASRLGPTLLREALAEINRLQSTPALSCRRHEHLPDDDEPITEKWVLELPNAKSKRGMFGVGIAIRHAGPGGGFDIFFYFDPDNNECTICIEAICIYTGVAKTRGDVRRLLTALGIEVTK